VRFTVTLKSTQVFDLAGCDIESLKSIVSKFIRGEVPHIQKPISTPFSSVNMVGQF
jgi:hypothetical protein